MLWGKDARVGILILTLRPFDVEEKRRRIQVALWAYAYEVCYENLVPDAKFDEVCRKINLSVATDRPDLDQWFRENFDPSTGLWVRKHPEILALQRVFEKIR